LRPDERTVVLARLEAARQMKRSLYPMVADEAELTKQLRLIADLSCHSGRGA